MSDLYAMAVTSVSLAKAVAEVVTGASATNTLPPAAVNAWAPTTFQGRAGEVSF